MKMFSLGMVLTAALVLAPVAAQDFNVELQRAVQKEAVSGDLKAAIQDYQRIAEAAPDRSVKARALLRMADAHRKLGDAEAKRIYEQIVSQFADQEEAAAEAKASLSGLTSTRLASTTRTARQLWVAAEATGMPSDDGRLLGYTDWETGDLALRDLEAGTSRRLTNTGGWEKSGDFAEFPIISPDSRQIAYAWIVARPTEAYEVRVLSLQGASGTPRTLVRSEQTALYPQVWTPDGRYLVAFRPAGTKQDVVLVSTSDGATRVVSTVENGRVGPINVSPDGRYISYSFPNGPSRQLDIAIVSLSGGSPTTLQHPAAEGVGFWTADGARFLFTSNRTGANALWSVPITNGRISGRPALVTSDIGSVVLKLDRAGRLFYVKGGNQRNVVAAPLDDSARQKTEPAPVSSRYVNGTSGPAWSPDGSKLAYYADLAPGSLGTRSVIVQEVATGEERTIVPRFVIPDGNGVGLEWFPDGRSLLAVGRGRPSETTEYHQIDLATSEARLIHTATGSGAGTTDPQISPDGRTLYYVRGPQMAARQIVAVDLSTRRETELLKGWFGSIALSPDGSRMAYLGNLESRVQPNELAVISVTGEGRRVVLSPVDSQSGMRFNTITWSRDSAFLFFVRPTGSGQQISRVSVDGGSPESSGIEVRGIIKNPQISPDGRRLAFGAVRPEPAELWVLENFLTPANAKKE